VRHGAGTCCGDAAGLDGGARGSGGASILPPFPRMDVRVMRLRAEALPTASSTCGREAPARACMRLRILRRRY
jgi:hypothetical protein